jgi:hypothetical protein
MINKDVVLIDLETSYTLSATWGVWDQNVAMVLREPYIISCAWKYLGEKTTHVISLPDFALYKKDRHNDKDLVLAIHKIFDDAKVLIAHNGNNFDFKWIYGRFAVHNIPPPSPCQTVDTLLIARSKFNFNSNKLADLGKYFDLGKKINTGGIGLWYKCVELGDKKSWNLMTKYNKMDVVLLERVYNRMLPFISNHPNTGLINGDTDACPNCGSKNLERRGFSYTRVGKFQRYQCRGCHSWHNQPIRGGQIR